MFITVSLRTFILIRISARSAVLYPQQLHRQNDGDIKDFSITPAACISIISFHKSKIQHHYSLQSFIVYIETRGYDTQLRNNQPPV